MDCNIHIDSSAALGVAQRRGNGKLRHVRVGILWIQEKVEEEEIKFHKVKGDENPADLLTKHLSRAKIDGYMTRLNQVFHDGRANTSLEI